MPRPASKPGNSGHPRAAATFLIGRDAPPEAFPDPRAGLPDRPLAMGGDLGLERLLTAYRRGIFPWYSAGGPILWWSPDPRAVLVPAELRISRRLRRRLRRGEFRVTENTAFAEVVRGCAAPRRDGEGETWITPEMQAAYLALHAAGHARSIECWRDGAVVGGLYGVEVGAVFCGESMFSRASDASKAALAFLCMKGYALVDCQVPNEHLLRLGVRLISRREFLAVLARYGSLPGPAPRPPVRW